MLSIHCHLKTTGAVVPLTCALCLVPDVVLKRAQYMFTSNVNDHRANRQLEDTCVKFRGFDSGIESDSNIKGYDAT